MKLNSRTLSIIAGSFLTLTFILFTISNALPLWRSFKFSDVSFTVGIWEMCTAVINTKTCLAISCGKGGVDFGACGKVLTAQILLTCTCIIAAISALCFLLAAIKSESINQKLLLTMKILVFISLIMGIIGVSVVIIATRSTVPQLKLRLDASAYIGIIAIIINLVAAIVAVLIK